MNLNPYLHIYMVDIRKGMRYERARAPVGQGDALADRFVVSVFDAGTPVDLTGGKVLATVIRPDGITVPVDGTVEDDAACVTLDDMCYDVSGDIIVTISIEIGEMRQTLLQVSLNVSTRETTMIAETPIWNLADLEAAVQRAEEAADRAEAAGGGGGGSGGIVTETDPTVPSWAKNPSPPTYTAEQVGADPTGTAYNMVSTHNADEDAHPAIRQLIPTKTSQLTNDSGYLTEHQDISHLLPRTELGAAVDVALAEAKASGAFDGEDGKTPVVGVDYYTPAEKAEFSQYIASEMAKRGQLEPEFANSIDDCTDESKLYVLPDGYIYAYMAYKTEGSKVPNFTNLMDDSGAYIKDGYRYSSSSAAFKTQASDCAVVIPINAAPSADMTIRMRGAQAGAAYASSSYFGPTNQAFPNAQGGNAPVFTTESNGDVTITVKNAAASGTKYGVFHVKSGVDADNLIVTLNEPITYTTTEGGTEYRWASTGHAFVPADYEGRIIELESNLADNSERIDELEEKVKNINADASLDAAYARIKNWNAPVFDNAPVFLLDAPKPALDANTIAAKPVAGIYAAYDALMEQYPHYITREDCGLASDDATHIYAYHFKTPVTRDNQGNTAAERKPTILACSGVHPLEQAGVYSLYYAMEEITTNTELGDLRRNVHFVVVPMLNPTAVSDTEYHMRNPDGIQVHYNFEVEFGSNGAVQGDQNYGGATPLSIPESQYFDALMAEYQDNLACVLSCHNFGRDNSRGAGYIWWSCGTTFMVNLGIRFCEKMSDAWHKKHGTTFSEGVQWANSYAVANWGGTAQPDWDMRVGWANLSGSGGTEYRQGMKYGVHGVNVEVCPLCMVLDKDATAYYSANAMTWGCETYVNFFRTYMAWYDLMRKQEYAPNLPWMEG